MKLKLRNKFLIVAILISIISFPNTTRAFSITDFVGNIQNKGFGVATFYESALASLTDASSFVSEQFNKLFKNFTSSEANYNLNNLRNVVNVDKIYVDSNILEAEKSKFDFIRKEVKGAIETGYLKVDTVGAVIQNTKVNDTLAELTEIKKELANSNINNVSKETISSLGFYDRNEVAALIAEMNNGFKTEITSIVNNLKNVSDSRYSGITQSFANTNAVNSLNNVTVTGIKGLTDADIPDDITTSKYLPLVGGNITGNLGVGTTSPYAPLSVNGQAVASYFTATSQSTSTFASGIDLSSGCFSVNGVCVAGGNVNNFSTTSSDYWLSQNKDNSFSSTSADYNLAQKDKSYF
ncbi:MAG: hypothetical protein WCO84_05090, partial [bacterium]